MRISRPLLATAVGAGALGASLALGLTMASAATSAAGSTGSSRSATTTASPTSGSTSPPARGAAPRPAMNGHKCTHMAKPSAPGGSTPG
ncbi:MAG: hypothetical protein ACLPKI_16395 [Streptosporangiaceae bacterium]